MRSPYGHPANGSTSGTAAIYEINEAPTFEVDYYAASNLTLTGGSTTLDGATLTEGKTIAAFSQSTGTEDGVLVVDSVSGATCNLVRAVGFKAGDKVAPGSRFYIKSGTTYGGREVRVEGTAVKVLGTDAITPEVVPDASILASTAGGALVGLADAGTYFTTDNAEAALPQPGAIISLGGITKLQLVTGTFVSGLCTVTVGANQAVTAATRAFPIMQAVVTGSTNVGMLTHMFASNVVGGNGVGQVLFRVLGNDGATDVDAAGAFAAILIN